MGTSYLPHSIQCMKPCVTGLRHVFRVSWEDYSDASMNPVTIMNRRLTNENIWWREFSGLGFGYDRFHSSKKLILEYMMLTFNVEDRILRPCWQAARTVA